MASTHRFSILLVDDEPGQRTVLAGFLRKKAHTVREAGSVGEALTLIAQDIPHIVLTDQRMTDRTGLDLLREVRKISPDTTLIIMTAFGTIEQAVQAMRDGAYSYLTKPIDLTEVDLLIQRVGEREQLISENRLLREQLVNRYAFTGIIAGSPAMEAVLNTAGRVAQSRASVLIRGESGTGKELVARAIHYNSPRAAEPFIAVNCAALNENLLESELFGHEKGAFTGADRQRRGRFEAADGGTLFLDEVGDIPLSMQVKLLRVLQERSFERVGGTAPIDVDVRLIAATNRDLESMIKTGTFREDLFYRLNVVTLEIPPLRDRREDIGPLAQHFTVRFAQENQRSALTWSREAWDLVQRHAYPGNVRELENIIQRAVILARHDVLTTDDLPPAMRNLPPEPAAGTMDDVSDLPGKVDRLEKELVLEALRLHNGNQSRAAGKLGLSERNLRYRLKKWGIK
jgi:two-component system NtrC family response regulator